MKRFLCVILCLVLMLPLSVQAQAYGGMFTLFQEKPTETHYGFYKHDNVLYKYDNDGAGYSKYSGFTKTKSGGKRYYVTGHACKGWRKIDGEWYYFRFSDGIAATGTEVIGGKKYYFNSDGTWSGKRSRTAAYPSDFSIKYTIGNMDSDGEMVLVDAKSRTCSFTDEDGKVTTKKMSKADIQAFYSMVIESGVADIKTAVNGFFIENNSLLTGYTPPAGDGEDEPDDPADTDYWWSDPETYQLEITMNGESYSVRGDDTAFLFAFTDKTAEKFCQLLWFINDYIDA
ncbi:MAG: hypothetical protein MRZ39_01140 [Oscillospiraceae bacterium]|nr:hypothetical protein [Oscillospiraceae bacterium]